VSSQKPDHRPLSEPPCWGSGELPLLPPEAAKRLKSTQVNGLIGQRAHRPPPFLSSFAAANWASHIASLKCQDKDKYLADLVIESLHDRIKLWPLTFNFVVIPEQLNGVEHLGKIPFRVDTIERLGEMRKFDDSGLRQLLSSTFLEAFELVGDVQVVLDLFVTGRSWLIPGRGGRLVVAPFIETRSLAEETNLMALRYARTLGVSPTSKYYENEMTLGVFGRRFGVSLYGEATLAECGDALGVSRERSRQIFERLPVRFARRQWPVSESASQIQASLLNGWQTAASQVETGLRRAVMPRREDAERYMSMYGRAPNSYKPNNDLEGRLLEQALTLSKIGRECFRSSESLGFVHESTALDRLTEVFAPADRSLLAEAMHAIQRFRLPDGYLYFEDLKGSSYIIGAISRVLGMRGPLTFEELYLAASRHAQYRRPGCVFPPRTVIRTFLSQDLRFVSDNDLFDIVSPPEVRLEGVALWMYGTISESPGCVIYRPELLDKARRAGHNGSSVQVFIIRHELFKTCPRNCVTLTGVFPAEDDIDRAYRRGQLVRINTTSSWRPKGDKFVIELVAGTDLCDGGLLSLDRALVGMFRGRRMKIMVSRSHHGHVGWSKGTTTGWATALRKADIAPGDRAEIVIDSARNTAHVKKIS